MTPVFVVKPRSKQLAHLAPVNAQQRLIQLWLHDKPQSTQKCYRRYAVQFIGFLAGVGKAIRDTTLKDLVEFSEHLQMLLAKYFLTFEKLADPLLQKTLGFTAKVDSC